LPTRLKRNILRSIQVAVSLPGISDYFTKTSPTDRLLRKWLNNTNSYLDPVALAFSAEKENYDSRNNLARPLANAARISLTPDMEKFEILNETIFRRANKTVISNPPFLLLDRQNSLKINFRGQMYELKAAIDPDGFDYLKDANIFRYGRGMSLEKISYRDIPMEFSEGYAVYIKLD
jgi:hypothetical protein